MQNWADFDSEQNHPILSSNTEHALFSTIKLANFLDIGQQILFMSL